MEESRVEVDVLTHIDSACAQMTFTPRVFVEFATESTVKVDQEMFLEDGQRAVPLMLQRTIDLTLKRLKSLLVEAMKEAYTDDTHEKLNLSVKADRLTQAQLACKYAEEDAAKAQRRLENAQYHARLASQYAHRKRLEEIDEAKR